MSEQSPKKANTPQFETPYQSYTKWKDLDYCTFCRYSHVRDEFYCNLDNQHTGKNGCTKIQEHVCSMAIRYREDI